MKLSYPQTLRQIQTQKKCESSFNMNLILSDLSHAVQSLICFRPSLT